MEKTNAYTNRHLTENCDECYGGKYRLLQKNWGRDVLGKEKGVVRHDLFE